MSAPSDSAGRPSPCACTNIALMQLFHELKQKFPAVPDHVVSNTIELYCHDKAACETHLHSEAKASLTHAYHASSVAAARKYNELRISPVLKHCPNQAIIKDRVQSPLSVKSVSCPEPQTAQISSRTTSIESEEEKSSLSTPKVKIDDNQNIVETKLDEEITKELPSPVTVINIDNCYAKYSKESPSDIESTSEELNAINLTADSSTEQPESTNYKILKSNKIKHNLNETLESVKDKTQINNESSICKESVTPLSPLHQITDKPKRPNTLDFKPNPDIAFKPTLTEPETGANNFDSPTTSAQRPVIKGTPNSSYWVDHGCPVNLSVNVNCHMDYNRGYDPWIENFDSPRTITSVNLTVCTPTSNMASPIRDPRDDDGRFEGQVTVTVSPSSGPQLRRRAPPPPPQVQMPTAQLIEPQKNHNRGPTEAINQGRSLIERQKERLGRLAAAIAQEKVRLSQLTRETHILAEPTPSLAATRRLRDYVHRLRDQCDGLAKKLEMCGNEPDSLDFYSHIYTGQPIALTTGRRPGRPAPPPPDEAPSWECHVCTFRNHGLLDKCEECEMPRILVGTSPSRTLDSGFGSFRDRSRRVNTHIENDGSPFSADVPDPQFSAAC